MKKTSLILSLVPLIFLTGCSHQSSENEAKINAEVLQLQTKLNETQNKLNKLEGDYNVFLEILSRNSIIQYNSAEFTPSSKEFQVINTDTGKFLVSLDKITKYVDGYKLKFSIGNINVASYTELKIETTYAGHTNETVSTNPILPGMWNNVTVILSPAKARDLSSITVSLETPSLNLTTDNRSAD